MEINLIIRELLANNNFISLPGIGSFIQKYEPARPSSDGLSFIPPKQIITFDSSRNFNDEAIENYICEKLGLSHPDAKNKLTDFVNNLNNVLSQGKSFTFENIGTLSKDNNGKYQFTQTDITDSATETYGLNEVSVTKINEKTKTEQPLTSKESSKTQKKSSSRVAIILSSIVGIAAIVALFILIPELRFWENTIKNSNKTSEVIKDTSNITTQNKVIAAIDSTLNKKDSINTKVENEIASNNVKKTALSYEEPKKQDSKMYYLIVGSFGKIENAQKLSDKFTQRGYKTEIIQGVNMYRVSINQFSDKNLAIAEFNKFRSQNPNESVWLLGQ